MTDRAIGVEDATPDVGVADFRTREQVAGTMAEQYLVPIYQRVRSFNGMVGSHRIPNPVSTAAYNIASIFNLTGSTVKVAVHSLVFQVDYPSGAATVRTVITTRITTAPTGGALITPTGLDTADSHSSSVEFRCAASADGTAAAITATAGTRFHDLIHGEQASTAANFLRCNDNDLLALTSHDAHSGLATMRLVYPFNELEPGILAAGEGYLVSLAAGDSTSGTAGAMNWIVNCAFEEYSLP